MMTIGRNLTDDEMAEYNARFSTAAPRLDFVFSLAVWLGGHGPIGRAVARRLSPDAEAFRAFVANTTSWAELNTGTMIETRGLSIDPVWRQS